MRTFRDCCVYKIGEDLYKKSDKNSGLHEYNLITQALSKSSVEDTLVIINGKISSQDEKELHNLMSQYAHKIFISSDAISFSTNIGVINECDVLLHQCPFNKIPEVNKKVFQHYSYVPELFYKPFDKPVEQDNLLFYGGGLRNERTLDYLKNTTSIGWLKSTEFGDNRLEYSQYIEEAKKHKFALIISRQDYIDLGWVTSRFVEAVSCWNYPIVDIDYDRFQYFGMNKMLSPEVAKDTIEKLSDDEFAREGRIKYYRNRFEKDSLKFAKLVEELTK